jgi:hypothetical protein
MQVPTPETISKIAEWREKARTGTLTRDEMREAIQFLRAEREAIPASAAKGKPAVNADNLLGELGI